MAQERLQKILARAGHGARRTCEEIITAGRVTVNGEIVSELGAKADPDADIVLLDGEPLAKPKTAYYALNKPAGYLTTMQPDTRGRRTVMELAAGLPARVFPVGRLDYNTEGLLLFTNDGDFANRVMHPGHGVVKTYEAVVEHSPTPETLKKLLKGVELEDGIAAALEIKITGRRTASFPRRGGRPGGPVAQLGLGFVIEMKIAEGRKRIVRRMLSEAGHPVLALRRASIGALTLEGIAPGQLRKLSREEVELVFK